MKDTVCSVCLGRVDLFDESEVWVFDVNGFVFSIHATQSEAMKAMDAWKEDRSNRQRKWRRDDTRLN
mgnify:CR=1 FL=1